MISRRDVVRVGLAACGCMACGGMAGGALAQGAPGPTAVKGAGYEMWFIGAQRDTIMNGKRTAALDLRTIPLTEVATELGLSHEAFYRGLAKLARRGRRIRLLG